MDKKYWLVCITLPKQNNEGMPEYKFYRVSTDDYLSVTVPLNTIAYGFVKSDESEEELLKNMVTLQFSNNEIYSEIGAITILDKIFVPCKLIKLDNGKKVIFNKEVGCIVDCNDHVIPVD